jgi:hypothetical protein
VLLANRAILGHVASGLAHEPDGSAVDGLGFAGANEDGIGRGHEPITVALLRNCGRALLLCLCETKGQAGTIGLRRNIRGRWARYERASNRDR